MRLRVLPSTFHSSAGPPVNIHQLFVWLLDLTSTSFNFLCCHATAHQFPSIFCAVAGPSLNFCSMSVQPIDHPSTSVTFLHGHRTLCPLLQLSVMPRDFRQLMSNLCATSEPPVNFHHFPCGRRTFHQLFARLSTTVCFLCSRGASHQLLSTFHAAA